MSEETKEQKPIGTIVNVDQGRIYVAKETEQTPLKVRMTIIGIQATVSAAVVAICGFVIITTPIEGNQRAVAWSTLASTLALWLPSPGTSSSNK